MDNAPIHTYIDIDELITSRDYKSIYFPSYSPELNSIKQFWSVVKNKVERGTFSDNKVLKTRIAEACNKSSHSSFKGLYTALLINVKIKSPFNYEFP